jgi:hypothetical protein
VLEMIRLFLALLANDSSIFVVDLDSLRILSVLSVAIVSFGLLILLEVCSAGLVSETNLGISGLLGLLGMLGPVG